ncbi:ligand-binding receptor [Enterovibrio norvegicus FF-33]|uniref:TRAP transporter substrate-binding protein DctP n=1 Tax=Enterovibrio norvegicus TaxID=188144 RepID=UPI0003640482|nr:TRAP transporter substrate-binding protein DctP [Enterovibrio norvegicus]OEE69794.1 ligand-binding receptor [Enterovibrio norvegicus FF-33]OEE74140.1 ligand-binding receptor [Enterovibrio norvegicus FF-162]
MKHTLLFGVFVMLLIGCDRQPDSQVVNPEQDAESFVLKLALANATGSTEHKAAKFFASSLESATQGNVTVELVSTSSRLSEREVIAQVQQNKLDIIITSASKLSHLVPEMQILDIPFLFEDNAAVQRAYESSAARTLLSALDEQDLKGLAFWKGGFKQLITTAPLSSLSDFKNRRFRIMESLVLREQFEHWGSTTVPIASNHVADAFAKKAIDGAEGTFVNIAKLGVDNLQITKTNHGYLSLVMMMSPSSFDSLPSIYQDALLEAVKATTQHQYSLADQEGENAYSAVNRKWTITQASPHLIGKMKDVSKTILERNRMIFGTALVEQVLQTSQNWKAPHPDALLVALDADLTNLSALSGLAIRRGIELALDEINAQGGLLGKEVKLVARDNSMVPSRGIDNIKTFAKLPNLIAVFSGISSPVALAELDLLHQHDMLMLVPWAAATPIVDNGHDPNFVFRVSVRDEYAAEFLLDGALDVSPNIGLMLVNNGWGRSNYEGLTNAMAERDLPPAHLEWFDWGEKDISSKTTRLIERGAEVIIYVGNPVEGQKFLAALATHPTPPVVISHWGITGSEFAQQAARELERIDLRVLQTFSFIDNDSPIATSLAKRYHQQYNTLSATDIFAPSGTAHAYDLMHLLAQATRKAGSSDMTKIRQEMKNLDQHKGVMKRYQSPFLSGQQDALTPEDYIFSFYKNGMLHPIRSTN